MRLSLVEVSGSLGDLGTFIPFAAAMSVVGGMDLGVILVFAGLASIFSGVLFGLPLGVQPMKALAAVAIAETLTAQEVAAAGIIVGAVVVTLAATGVIEKIERVVPLAVVRGVQLGVGVKLALGAVSLVRSTRPTGVDSVIMAAGLLALTIAARRFARYPAALILFVFGMVVAFAAMQDHAAPFHAGAPEFTIVLPTGGAWVRGLLSGAIPQLPLTLLNSVLAVCALSGDLFPGRRIPAHRAAASIGVVNLVGCWFGAMPMCHGAGNLAAQYHFGARTGGAPVFLGVCLLMVGLLGGAAVASLAIAFPRSVLGVMLLLAAFELMLPARDQTARRAFSTMIITATGIVAVSAFAGFLMGIATAAIVALATKRR